MNKDAPILILENDTVLLKILQKTLELEKYICFGTHDTQIALNYIKENTAAIVLSDQYIHDMCGIQFLQHVKQIQPLSSRILVTGMVTVDNLLEAINVAEVYRYLVKPWTHEQIVRLTEDAYKVFEKKRIDEQAYQAILEANCRLVEENCQLRT